MNEELNKKIALWLGGGLARYYKANPNGLEPNHAYFTHSLDACFEYIVPEIEKRFGWQEYYRFLLKWITDFTGPPSLANPPALALCRAVEKLIDAPH